MIRVSKNEFNNKLIFQFVSFSSQEIDMIEDMLIQYYGSYNNIPKYTYLSLSFIRESLKLDMLEGVVYVDNARIEENLKRLFGGNDNND